MFTTSSYQMEYCINTAEIDHTLLLQPNSEFS